MTKLERESHVLPNPFAKKPPKVGGAPAFKKKPKAKPKQLFETAEWQANYAERMAIGKKMLGDIKVGDTIRVTWSYNDGATPHTGVVVELDDWLRCKPFSTSNGVLNIPVAALVHVDAVELA